LIAGEYEGQIYIYDIGSGKKSKTLDDNSKELFEPSKVMYTIRVIIVASYLCFIKYLDISTYHVF
jgi:uncharacterized protein YqfB (UPF0267 family)